MALPKWTEERTQQLVDAVGSGPVSQETVKQVAVEMDTSTRSVSSKLRKMGHEVELASAVSTKSFSDAQESTLEAFVTDNSGQYTYAEIASSFEDGHFSAKSIQGKILSMELTSHVKPAEKQESVRTYSPDEETTFVNCEAWDSGAETICKWFDKGDSIIVHGSLKNDKWEDKDGNMRYREKIRVSTFEFPPKGKQKKQDAETSTSTDSGNFSSKENVPEEALPF